MRYAKPQIIPISTILIILGFSILGEKSKSSSNFKQLKKMETKADYKKILPFVLKWEGGVSDHKDDTGGLTNRGVTYATYQKLCLKIYGCQPNLEHFMTLSYDEVGLMVQHFWNVATCNNSINSQKVSEAIFNWYWGSGTDGLKWFQGMLNDEFNANLVVDGIVGKKTIELINSINEDDLFKAAIYCRYATFHTICKNNPTQKVFLRGWLNRLDEFAKRHGYLMSAIVENRF